MTDPTPVSPPAQAPPPPPSSSTAPATADTDAPPLSPIQHTSSFPHQTSASVATRTPFIDTSTPAINGEPVELDGETAASPVVKHGVGLAEEADIEREFLGEGEAGEGDVVREKRAAMLASRSKDPGVIVDVPSDPTAEEVEAARSADGTVTPGVGGEGKN